MGDLSGIKSSKLGSLDNRQKKGKKKAKKRLTFMFTIMFHYIIPFNR